MKQNFLRFRSINTAKNLIRCRSCIKLPVKIGATKFEVNMTNYSQDIAKTCNLLSANVLLIDNFIR